MKKIFVLGVAAIALAACGRVPAGNVGVKVNMLGDDKGGIEVVSPGKYWLGWNEELFIFPTFMQNYVWTKSATEGSPNDESLSFQDKDGLVANADIGISYAIEPTKAGDIFAKYRRGVDEITDVFLHNMVRDALVRETADKNMEYLYGSGKAEIMNNVTEIVRNQVKPLGINVDKIYWIGEIRLPPQVEESINNKIQATQKAQQRQNEVAQSRAEADKKIEDARGDAESILKVAEAQAKANKILSESITSNLVQYKMIEKWNGEMPKITGGNTSMLLQPDILNSNKGILDQVK
jgi:regulator of protease activity HflC (stomatin/prohibitin superfamily)